MSNLLNKYIKYIKFFTDRRRVIQEELHSLSFHGKISLLPLKHISDYNRVKYGIFTGGVPFIQLEWPKLGLLFILWNLNHKVSLSRRDRLTFHTRALHYTLLMG